MSRQSSSFRSLSRRQINSWSVTLEAAGIAHEILPSGRGWEILVPVDLEQRAVMELSQVEAAPELADETPHRPPATPLLPRNILPSVLPLTLLLLLHLATGSWYEDNPWFERGAVHAVQIIEHHEWWRLVTGLTLHADMAHLTANLLTGGVLLLFLAATCGSGMAWLLVLLGGTGGNLLNLICRNAPHLSVGFSTAVFAMVGLLVGLQLSRHEGRRLPTLLWSLAAGFALLALLGTGGERTDLGAHLFGLLTGIPLGFLASHLGLNRLADRPVPQTAFLLTVVLIALACWSRALADISLK